MADANLLDQIREQVAEINATKAKLKTLREMQADHLQQMPEYQELEEAKLAITGKQDKLKIALSQDGEYNDRQEDIADWKRKLDDQQDILSLHLIQYRDDEDASAVEFGDKERPIQLQAKLGKERDIQIGLDFGSTRQ